MPVDFEELAQLAAEVAAAVAVGSERDVSAGPRTDESVRRTSGCSRSRRRPAPCRSGRHCSTYERRGGSWGCSRFQRRAATPSRCSSLKLVTLQTSACTFHSSASRSARGEHFAQDRARAEQLHARRLVRRGLAVGRSRYMPRRMPSRASGGIAGCRSSRSSA